MFEDYQASKEDLEAIEEGIKTAWRPEMNFVFKDRNLLKNIVVISYDSKFLYLWTKFKLSYKIPYKIKITDEMQMGWGANAYYFYEYLPKILQGKACISGSLLTPFTKIHQKYLKNYVKNKEGRYWAKAYSSYESYLATIMHEVGHIYYNSMPLSTLNQKANLKYLKTVLRLYKGKKTKKFPRIKPYRSFAFEAWTEIFAFCTEYYAAKLFWPEFKKDLDHYWETNITRLRQNPSFLTSRQTHSLSAVIGKILISSYPRDWPRKIFNF